MRKKDRGRCACGATAVVLDSCRACYLRAYRLKHRERINARYRQRYHARPRKPKPAVMRVGRVEGNELRRWRWPQNVVRIPVPGWGVMVNA